MNLLDLPPEIFASIIHAHLNHGDGWAVAVQARYVCKTFAVAIHNDMFGRYSASQYRCLNTDWKERLLRPNMHTVLFKMGHTRCDSTYILDHMEATVDFLMEFSFYKTESQRERYRLALCNAMSVALSIDDILAYLCEGPFDDSVRVRKNMGRADTVGMLAAAAAVNSEAALRFLVGKVHDVGQRSELYGTPLTAAAVNGHVYSSALIFESMKNGVRKHNQLYDAVDTSMHHHRAAILPRIMHWYLRCRYSGKSTRHAKEVWTDWAVLNGELDVLRFCYDPKHAIKRKRRLEATPFYLACQYGHTHLVEHILQVDPNLKRAIRTCGKDPTGVRELRQGLTAAVENGWLVTTRLLIHSGVRIDPRRKRYISFTPMLWYAVKGGHIDMVVLLLAYGAVVPERNFAKHDDIWALATKRSPELASLIEEAWDAQVKQRHKVSVGSVP